MTSLSRLCRKTARKTLPGLLLISTAAVSGGHYATIKITSADSNNVYFTVTYNFLEDNSNQVIQCKDDNDCFMSTVILMDRGDGKDVIVTGYPSEQIKSGMSLKEIRDLIVKYNGSTGSRNYSLPIYSYNAYKCVGFAIHSKNDSGNFEMWPGTPCTNAPPPNVTCSFSLPSSVDFGTVSSGKPVSVQRRINGNGKCSGNATVTAYLTKPVQLDGVNVAIDMNGQRLESGKNIDVGAGQNINLNTDFNVSGTFSTEGDHTANAIIEMNFY